MIIDDVESFPIFLFPIAFFNLQNCKILSSFVTRVVIKNGAACFQVIQMLLTCFRSWDADHSH